MFLQEIIEEFLIYSSSIRCFSPNTITGYSNDLKMFLSLLEKQGAGSVECINIDDINLQNLRSCISFLSKEKRRLRRLTDSYPVYRPAYAQRMHYSNKILRWIQNGKNAESSSLYDRI